MEAVMTKLECQTNPDYKGSIDADATSGVIAFIGIGRVSSVSHVLSVAQISFS